MKIQPELLELLSRAEGTLAIHLAEVPTSKHNLLVHFYSELRSGARREAYPTARDLFWDDPGSVTEERCLHDALAVFDFVRDTSSGTRQIAAEA